MSGLEGARCRDEDPRLFESRHRLDHEEAAAICARCPVRAACHELAQTLQAASPVGACYGIQGTWGGVLYGGKDRKASKRRHLRAVKT